MAKKDKEPAEKGDFKDFEKHLEELESIAEKLSAGDVKLDDAISEYEKGVKLLKTCHAMLDEAEKKIRVLVRNSKGEFEEKEFASGSDEQ